MLDATVQNLVARETWRPEFVHPGQNGHFFSAQSLRHPPEQNTIILKAEGTHPFER
jgi:hypothetical protein